MACDHEVLALPAGGREQVERSIQRHSDRAIQYAAADYQRLLAAYGIDCSMSRKGNCWDDVVVESVFHTLKVELVHDRRHLTRDNARQDICEWIEVFCKPATSSLHARLPFAGRGSKQWTKLLSGVSTISGEDHHRLEMCERNVTSSPNPEKCRVRLRAQSPCRPLIS